MAHAETLGDSGDLTAVRHQTAMIDGLSIFYREAGDRRNPTLVLLHGFPSSSVMFRDLVPRLADRLHLIAPDYPGFGRSDAPAPQAFRYTFDHLTEIVDRFLEQQRIVDYSLYLQDYGGPIGFRLALAHPERVRALVIQNAVAHEQGLSDLWVSRKAFWADRAAHEASVRAKLLSLEATRQRHVGRSPPDSSRHDRHAARSLSRLSNQRRVVSEVAGVPARRPAADARGVGQARPVVHRRGCGRLRGKTCRKQRYICSTRATSRSTRPRRRSPT
jgi:pimeloyl-ACP methyl ester carboxylesterase